MNRLIAFLLGLTMTIGAAVAADFCPNISNRWTMPNTAQGCYQPGVCGSGNSTWTLNQDQNGYLTGEIDNYYCPLNNAYYNYTLTPGSSTGGSKSQGTGTVNGV